MKRVMDMNVIDMTESRKREEMAMRLTGNREEARSIRKNIEDRALQTREEIIDELIGDTLEEEFPMTREEAEWFLDH